MPLQHFPDVAAEAGSALWIKKQMFLIGVGMVVQKIKTEPRYTMWATVIGMLLAGFIQFIMLTLSMDSFFEAKIKTQLDPLVISLHEQKNYFELKHDFSDQTLQNISKACKDSKEEVIALLNSCKVQNKEEHSEIKERLTYLEHK